MLIHGFGASSRHWRFTLPALATSTDVIAVDLLGFGASDKPRSQLADEPAMAGSVRYGFDLWARQVVDLLQVLEERSDQTNGQPATIHLIGNSIGAVVALAAACLLQQRGRAPAQVILIDCAQRKLDDRRLSEQPWPNRLSRPLLKQLVRQREITSLLFQLLARPALIRQVLKQAYPSGHHVDAELIELLYEPTRDPGARESFRGFINLFNERLATDLLAELSSGQQVTVRMIWGTADPWEDPAEARAWTRTFSCIETLIEIAGAGHCPHDEAPEPVNEAIGRWLGLETPSADAPSGEGPDCRQPL